MKNTALKALLLKRQEEIEEGGSNNPLFIVFDEEYVFVSGHYESLGNLGFFVGEFGFLSMKKVGCNPSEEKIASFFEEEYGGDVHTSAEKPEPTTKIVKQKAVAYFLTLQGALEYLNYQSHNLSKHARVVEANFGINNHEMEIFRKEVKKLYEENTYKDC
jgi:hypothetical protein